MDRINTPSHLDRAPAGSDNQVTSPFNAHDLLAHPDLTREAAQPSQSSADKHLPSLSLTDFDHNAESFLARYAPDNGSHVTREDLARLIGDPDIKGADAVTLATLYNLSTSPFLLSQSGALAPWGIKSISDIAAAPTSAAGAARDSREITALTNAIDYHNFSRADRNHDGALSLAEIERDPQYASLLRQVPDLAPVTGSTDYRLTRDMLNNDMEKILARDTIQFSALYTEAMLNQRMLTSTTAALFSDKANPLNSIKMSDVHQGLTGDCYFEATLAEIAQQNPAIIRDAIRTNPDGTYTVTFQGDLQHPVTVAPPTDAELALYNGGSNDGLWPAVMEKAYASYATTVLKRPVGDLTDEDAIAGGRPSAVMQLFTGRQAISINNSLQVDLTVPGGSSSADNKLDPYSAQVAGIFIGGALDHGSLAVIYTADSDAAQTIGLVRNHAYSVVDYKPGSDGGLVTLRNPLGSADGSSSDTIQITMDKLYSTPVTFDADMGGNWPPPPVNKPTR